MLFAGILHEEGEDNPRFIDEEGVKTTKLPVSKHDHETMEGFWRSTITAACGSSAQNEG